MRLGVALSLLKPVFSGEARVRKNVRYRQKETQCLDKENEETAF